ncbi:hypothetical protein FRB98_000219 [Tulasnella sp. 332]|nr:hypothetical protein FRB98_000219 [Tulasnella sp. 332]
MSGTPQNKLTLSHAQYASSPFHNAPIHMGLGSWMCDDQPDHLNDWLEKWLADLEKEPEPLLHQSVIEDFRNLIETDPEVYMGFHRIFDGVPAKDPLGRRQVKDYKTMLRLFNGFLSKAPEFDNRFLVFLPFTAVLQWPLAMANGLTILINRQVNDQFHRLFEVWSQFLASTESRYVLTESETGWLGPVAMKQMPNFVETFVCDPKQPYWGFQSWDHFFARPLRDGARPVSSPGDSSIITSACESKVLRIAYNVREREQFWIKGQPYSLAHMLNNHPEARSFIGGTVYQAFLSPFYYHRWSSPVDGVVERVEVVQGTYFAGVPSDQLPDENAQALQGQQSFLSQVATRALIFIKANDPKIGLMCFIGIGMVEVSSCEITVSKGQAVKKGDGIGTFHFGGSTHCLVFGPNTKMNFLVNVNTLVPVHQAIAQVQ